MKDAEPPQRGGSINSPPPASKYYLDGDVAAQIKETLILDEEELIRRAQIRRGQPGFLREETMVYVIREYLKAGNDSQVLLELATILENRCRLSIRNKQGRMNARLLEQLEDNVIARLYDELFKPPYQHHDFLEAKFLMYMRARRVDERRKLGEGNYALVPLYDDNGDDIEIPQLEDGQEYWLEPNPRDLEEMSEISYIRDVVLPRIVADPDHVTAYILHHYYGWQIDSMDSQKQTLTKHFHVSGRTIRNWLKRADGQIETWREDQGHE